MRVDARHPWRWAAALAAFAALVPSACSSDDPPEQVVRLRLFAVESLKLDQLSPIEVSASQGDRSGKTRIDDPASFFADCESNLVQIYPSMEGGALRDKVIQVTVSSIERDFIKEKATIASFDPPPIVVGPRIGAAGVRPAGECAPSPVGPDGGSDSGTDTVQAQPHGSPCTTGTQCEGGVCLNDFRVSGDTYYLMDGGYCSSECTGTDKENECGEGLYCKEARPTVSETRYYCLKRCETDEDCRQQEGYQCTPAGKLCFPKEQQ